MTDQEIDELVENFEELSGDDQALMIDLLNDIVNSFDSDDTANTFDDASVSVVIS